MGLFDRFRPKPPHPLLPWLEAQGGMAHGRRLRFDDVKYENGERELHLFLQGRDAPPDRIQFQRPETYLTPEQARSLPSVHTADWRAAMDAEDLPSGLHVGGGFVLDPDFNPDSPLVARHIKTVGGYLERFSRGVYQIVYEPPWLELEVARDAAERDLRRDIECAHELLSLLEQP